MWEDEDTARLRLDPEAARLSFPGPREEGVITVLRGTNAGALFAIDGQRSVIGRSAEAQVLLTDQGLSRTHAAIARRKDGFYIEDLGSTNGTIVDGQRIAAATRLEDGARIELGVNTILRFGLHDQMEQEAARRTHEMMVRDPLTRLFNRRHLEERLESEVAFANRHATPLSVIMVDVDKFKPINDKYGHSAGDAVLRALGAALQRMIRTEDLLARYGGEEFTVVARGIEREGACAFAERMRQGVEIMRIPLPRRALQITVSIGLSHAQGERDLEAKLLLGAADQALYEAKDAGRNRVVLADRNRPGYGMRPTVPNDGVSLAPIAVSGRPPSPPDR